MKIKTVHSGLKKGKKIRRKKKKKTTKSKAVIFWVCL